MRNNIIIFKALLLMVAAPLLASAQHNPSMCEITATIGGVVTDLSQPICSESGKDVRLSVPSVANRIYYWSDNNTSSTHTTSSITVHPLVTTTYMVRVIDTVAYDTCNNHVEVKVYERFNADFEQLKLTCSNSESDYGNTAQLRVTASGGQGGPFLYDWVGIPHYQQMEPDNTIAIGLQAYREYKVKITDTSCGCYQIAKKTTRGFPTPDIEIFLDPGDSVYVETPDVTFSFENHSEDSIPVVDHIWTFEHGITSTQAEPVFTYVEPNDQASVSLTVYDDCGCDTTFTHPFKVLPVELKIPTVFTPNADGYNDTFVITLKSHSQSAGSGKGNNRDGNKPDEKPLSTYYKKTELMVFNRWGRIVYSSKDYQNDWDGGGLSDGTYFYVLKCYGLKDVVQYQGSVMILTKSRK